MHSSNATQRDESLLLPIHSCQQPTTGLLPHCSESSFSLIGAAKYDRPEPYTVPFSSLACPHVTFPLCQHKSVSAVPHSEPDPARNWYSKKRSYYFRPCIFPNPSVTWLHKQHKGDAVMWEQVAGKLGSVLFSVVGHAAWTTQKVRAQQCRDAAGLDSAEPGTVTNKKNPILILKNIRKGYVGHIQLHVTTGTFNIRDLQSIYYTHHDTWSLQSMSQDLQCEAKSCKIQNATEEGREGYCQHQLLVTAG